jgi:hypothetical protein
MSLILKYCKINCKNFNRRGQERVELYLYSPSGPTGLLRGTFTFTYIFLLTLHNTL